MLRSGGDGQGIGGILAVTSSNEYSTTRVVAHSSNQSGPNGTHTRETMNFEGSPGTGQAVPTKSRTSLLAGVAGDDCHQSTRRGRAGAPGAGANRGQEDRGEHQTEEGRGEGVLVRRTIILTTVAIAMAACATSVPDQSSDKTTTAQPGPGSGASPDPGAPGRPGKTDAGQAAGAPIRIPAFTMNMGASIVNIRETAVREIAAACGGCVSVTVAQGTDTTRSICQYSDFTGGVTEQNSETTLILIPGTTLTLLTGTLAPEKLPCSTDGYLPKNTSEIESPPGTVSPAPPVTGVPKVTDPPTVTDPPSVTNPPTEPPPSKPSVTVTE